MRRLQHGLLLTTASRARDPIARTALPAVPYETDAQLYPLCAPYAYRRSARRHIAVHPRAPPPRLRSRIPRTPVQRSRCLRSSLRSSVPTRSRIADQLAALGLRLDTAEDRRSRCTSTTGALGSSASSVSHLEAAEDSGAAAAQRDVLRDADLDAAEDRGRVDHDLLLLEDAPRSGRSRHCRRREGVDPAADAASGPCGRELLKIATRFSSGPAASYAGA